MTGSGRTTAVAYCSSANLGSGFDVFGLALDHYRDIVTASRGRAKGKVRITIEGNNGQLPVSPSRNSAGPPAIELLRKMSGEKKSHGLEISVRKGVPAGIGLGSSGATAAACTRAVDSLLGLDLSDDELVGIASLGEKAVSGHAHADNVAASFLGGFTIVYGRDPVRTVSIRPPSNLVVAVVTPKVNLPLRKTQAARKLLPGKIPIPSSVSNTGHASAMVAGFLEGNVELIGRGMHDEIAEPYREKMIPCYKDVKKAAFLGGASGVAISGAGPSIIAVLDQKKNSPGKTGTMMIQAFRRNGVEATFFTAKPARGAMIVGD